jgi:hypothetical protein
MRTSVLRRRADRDVLRAIRQTRKNCVFNSGNMCTGLLEAMETCFSAQTGGNCIQEEKVVERKKKN